MDDGRRGPLRLALVAALLALAGVPFAAGASAAQVGGASLTVHARSCPVAYAANAFDQDCHDTPLADAAVLIRGPRTATGETDAAGNVRFATLPPGSYAVEDAGIPFDFIDRLVPFCSSAAAPGVAVPFVAQERGVRVGLEPGQHIVCDLYYVGSDARGAKTARLTIHNRICPAGFAGPDYYGACHDTPAPPGLTFSVDGPDPEVASTDDTGNTAFRLAPGRHEVRGGVPGEFATLAVFCAPAATPGVAFPFDPVLGGVRGPSDPVGIEFDLADGDAVVCDWYNTPEPGR